MDWISHIIIGLAATRLVFLNRPQDWEKFRNIIILIALPASLFPDIDIFSSHRSEIHAPLVLLALAGVIAIVYPVTFRPLLAGFWSHSLLDIFLFDNSRGTIRNVIDVIVTNDTAAGNINDVVVTRFAAEGIMLLYPISRNMYYILLTEHTYPAAAVLVILTAIVTFYLTR